MKSKKELTKQVREFYQDIAENERELINQFTEEGVDLLVDYYNSKYRDERGEIHRVHAPIILADLKDKDPSSYFDGAIQSATNRISELKKENDLPIKIMFTFLQKETADSDPFIERGRHSIPFLLTDQKLILLREEGRGKDPNFEKLANNLELEFIQQKEPAFKPNIAEEESIFGFLETKLRQDKPKRTSIQGDHSNCNGIAIGILKDLTKEDCERISNFSDRYTPLAKMLKYSQSSEFVKLNYPELQNEVVKFDENNQPKTTLIDYISQGKAGGEKSKITTKMNVFRNEMSEIMKSFREGGVESNRDEKSNLEKLQDIHQSNKTNRER